MAEKKFYKPFEAHPGYAQKFDIRNTTYKRGGKDINVFDEIQANRTDTEIIPTLRKYGNLKPLEVDYKGLYGVFEDMNLRDAYETKEKAEKAFNQLPAELKEIFNNDAKEFYQKAPKWLEEKIKTIQAEPTTPTKENQPEGVNNEQSAN